MNRIYKVIWNKTRGMYMVVSELAKGQSKDGRRAVGRKKVAQTAAALAVFFSIVSMGGTSFAADGTTKVESSTSGTAVEVYTKNGTDAQIEAARKYTYRKAAELDTRITNVKEYLEQQTSDKYVSKADAAVQDGAIVKAANTIGENVTNLDAALAKETAARIGADKAQDKVIQAVNDNLVQSVTTINKNVSDGFTALNQADANEAAAREAKDNELNERITNEAIEIHKTTNQLQSDLNTETAAREAGDTALNTRITNVKEYLEQQTSDKYVSKADAAVQDGAIVKANKTIGENVTNLDAALASETAARIGADKAQDKVIQAVNDNLVQSVNTINQNMAAGFNALSQADANELAGRVAADTELAKAVNNGLSLDQDNVLQKNTTSVGEDGTVTTSKKAATTLVMNKGGNNQITLSKNGIKVGLNSTVQDAKGFYAGGDTAAAAKAALNADGSIKGADGKFTVDTAGNVATKGGSIKTNGGVIQTGGGNINTQGGALRTNGGNINAGSGTITGNKLTDGVASLQNGDLTTTGNINAHDIVATGDISGKAITGTSLNTQGGDINGGAITGTTITGTTGAFGSLTTTGNASVGGTLSSNGLTNTGNATTDTLTVNHNATVGGNLAVTGDITGKSLNVGTGAISGGQITGTGLDVGAGTIKTTGAVETGTLETTGNATIGGNLTVDKDLTVNGVFDAKTLSSTVDANNYTTINGGKTQSKNLKMDTATGETKASASTFDETGSNLWAKDDESIGKSTVTADSISQKLSDTGDNPTAYAESAMSQGTDNKYTMTDTVKDGDKTNVAFQSATESSDVITEGSGDSAKTSTFRQKIDQILQEIKTSDEIYSKIDQTVNKTNSTVRDGANSTSVEQGTQDITHTAKQGTISNIAKDLVNTATGDMTNTVGGKMLNNVTGDMENKVGGNLTTTVGGNETHTVGGTLTETVTGDVTEDYKANLSTTVGGNQTTTVTGDSSLTAENITNEARNKITNKALDVETDASSSIVNKVSNDAGSNTSTQLSYQTTEEMSQADGKTASYLRGAAEEKSQLTDGDKKTTIDTIAGQTNTNITDGTNTSNSLQKADQVASSVTDGTNTTVVNQDAKSLASSITDGTKANNTNSTVDKSEQLIKASDTRYSATTKTASKTEDALVSGSSVIDVIKSLDDAANPLISSAVTDGTNTTGVTQTAKDITNTAKNGTIANDAQNITNTASETLSNSAKNITNTAAEKLSNKAADIENLASSSILNKVGDNVSSKLETDKITTVVKDGSKSNTVTETASASEQKMVSGNIIDILKDAETGYVNTTVKTSDESSSTSVNQGTADITNTAKQGTITNAAKNLVNKAAESITNTAGTQIQDVVGKSKVTTTDTGTTFENSDHAAAIGEGSITKTTISGNTLETGKATADYVDVNKDLHVMGNTQLDGTLEVAGKSAFKDDVTMDKNLEVKGTTTTDQLVVNNGANITGGTTTDTLHVTNTATFDGKVTFKDAVSMEKDLSVGGSATVTGDVTAKSYKVGDKTYINENGINANGQKITNVADGTIAEGSTDAVNGGQLNATNQRVTTVENRMDGVENRMDRVENRVDNLDNRIDKVGASAAAMANLHPMDFDEDSKVSVAAAMGSYRSETAGALGVFYRPTDRVMLNVSTSFGNGENMVGGGVSFKLGKSSKRLEKAEATNVALAKQVTNLQNRLDALLGVLNPSLSKDFPDVPANHWAYEAVSRLAGNDIVQGYEDGKYHGERTMTRYEMAEIIYNALSKGAKAEAKLVEEFRPELQAMAAQRKA